MISFNMIEIGWLAAALFSGVMLSGLYFGGLWITLRRLPLSRHPAILLMLSLTSRMALLLSGFYLILKVGQWDHLSVALIGFILARILLARRLGPEEIASIAESHSEISS